MENKLTYAQLVEQGLDAITVKSTVIDPNEWYFTKQGDGLYWPHGQREMFIIISGDSHSFAKDAIHQRCSFSLEPKDICFWHTKPEVVKDYSLHDYIMDYGHELVEVWNPDECRTEFNTVLQHLKTIIPALRKYRHGTISEIPGDGGFVYYADFDKARASEWMKREHLHKWAKNNGIVLLNPVAWTKNIEA